jgi:Fe2+/Zn2+ uptake regulation proteins
MIKIFDNEEKKINEKLKDNGYKLTLQRKLILENLLEHEGEHLTIEELYDIVKVEFQDIGLATVYRTMQLFEDIGLVSKLNLDDGCYRYELVHENERHRHHHLICLKCGKVTEVQGDLLESLEQNIEKRYDFQVQNHSVKIFGICSECKKKE